jgi:hypothetical protein
LTESDGKGFSYEVMPESRLVPGYLQTMIDWIGDQSRGTPLHNRIDAGSVDVIQARGAQRLPWYGSAPVQVVLLAACTIGSLLTLLGWPAIWVARRIRRLPRDANATRGPIVICWFVNFVALAMCAATLAILRFLADALPSTYYGWAAIDLWILAALTAAIVVFAVVLIRKAFRQPPDEAQSRWSRVLYWVSAVTVCLWVPFFVYWTWGPLLGS